MTIISKRFFILGIVVSLIPLSGFPATWKTALFILCGLFLIVSSVSITLPKKLPKRIPRRREKVTPVFSESIPVQKETIIKEKDSDETFV